MGCEGRTGENLSLPEQGAIKEGDLMKIRFFALAVILFCSSTSFAKGPAASDQNDLDRVHNAGVVMQEILNVPDDIPRDLLDKARCVVVMPSVLKAAFVVGGSYGRGVMVCRTGQDFTGPWGAPAMYALEGGSVGFQIGGEATDFVFLIMNSHGVDSLLHSKVKLGGDASAAAGPVGRTAEADSDAYLRAEILTYSRARGAFAGISLEGSTLRPDDDANKVVYGSPTRASEIIMEGRHTAPEQAHLLDSTLQHASPARKQ
jgi:SH3 domain-containing YSC84-like protein 1